MGGLSSLAGSVIGAGVSAYSQHETNKMNLKIAREQMKFQERMSSTAHQREVSDLQKAGLNPILSATGGQGASAPSGASATMENELAGVGEEVSSAVKKFQEAQLREKEKVAQDSGLENDIAEREVKGAQVELLKAQKLQVEANTAVKTNEIEKGATKSKIYGALNEHVVTPLSTTLRQIQEARKRAQNSARRAVFEQNVKGDKGKIRDPYRGWLGSKY